MRPQTWSESASARVWSLEHAEHLVAQRLGRQRAGGVARVHPRLLDVLHDAGDQDLPRVVTHGIDVHLDGILQEAVHQDGPLAP